jgi:hypothetical protein
MEGSESAWQSGLVADVTLRNLQQQCLEEIQRGRLLVVNAVWGLRPLGSGRVGYLGDAVHKVAFPCWFAVVSALTAVYPSCSVFVAGDWGRWKDHHIGSTVRGSEYFAAWERFCQHGVQAQPIPSAVTFIPHPCTWGHRFPRLP